LQHVALLTKEWGMTRLTKILRNSRGGTAIEYALVASLIAVAAIVGMNNLGGKLGVMFNNVSNHI
jgi:pilus assembly protein Flp/PilA